MRTATKKKKRERKSVAQVIADNREAYERCTAGAGNEEMDQAIKMHVAELLNLDPCKVIPRENLLTFNAWKGCGKVVKRGEKAVWKGTSYVPIKPDGKQAPVNPELKLGQRKVNYFLFHITQTEELGGEYDPTVTASSVPVNQSEPKQVKNQSDKFKTLAAKMQNQIDHKMADRLTNTPKRQLEATHARREGERLQRTQAALIGLAALHDSGSVPDCLMDITSKKQVYELVAIRIDTTRSGYYDAGIDTGKPYYDTEPVKAIFAMLTPKSEEEIKQESIKKRIDDLQFSKIPGYFPTPKPVIDLMIQKADLFSYCSVLEPSAGSGNICDELVKGTPIELSVFEKWASLKGILHDKGYNVMGDDFMDAPADLTYDRVLMNPPFENLQDVDHVMKAYDMLNPLGCLVAIMSPSFTFRSDKKCKAFLEFVELNGHWEQLPDNSFKESGTNVNTVIVVIDKGE